MDWRAPMLPPIETAAPHRPVQDSLLASPMPTPALYVSIDHAAGPATSRQVEPSGEIPIGLSLT